jgi:hypothetical protein
MLVHENPSNPYKHSELKKKYYEQILEASGTFFFVY